MEANPELEHVIRWLRPNDRLIIKAVNLKGEKVEFMRLEQDGLSTINYATIDEITRMRHRYFDIKHKYVVDGIRIGEIIETLETNTPDLMSIDIEGMDWDILHEIDFGSFRPEVIISELVAWGRITHSTKEFHDFFESQGYLLFHNNYQNAIYYDSKYKEKINRIWIKI